MTDYELSVNGSRIWTEAINKAPLNGSADDLAWAYVNAMLDIIELVNPRFARSCRSRFGRHHSSLAVINDPFFVKHIQPLGLPLSLFCLSVQAEMRTIHVSHS